MDLDVPEGAPGTASNNKSGSTRGTPVAGGAATTPAKVRRSLLRHSGANNLWREQLRRKSIAASGTPKKAVRSSRKSGAARTLAKDFPSSENASAQQVEARELVAGDRAVLHGLKTAKFNGRHCVLDEWDAAQQRWSISLLSQEDGDPQDPLLIKPVNLKVGWLVRLFVLVGFVD